MTFTVEQRLFIIEIYLKTKSFKTCQKEFIIKYPNVNVPVKNTIHKLVKKFRESGSVLNKTHHRVPTVCNEETIEDIKQRLQDNPNLSVQNLSQQSGISRTSCQRILKKLYLKSYKVRPVTDLKTQNVKRNVVQRKVYKAHGKEVLYDSAILKNMDWSQSKGFFYPEISPTNPGDNFVIRPLTTSDYDKGFPFILKQVTDLGDLSKDQFLDTFRQMKDCAGTYYVTVIEDKNTGCIAGCASLLVERKFTHSCALRGRIEDVVISNTYQDRQLEKLIVETLKQMGKNLGCYEIFLDCKDDMKHVCAQLGFRRDDHNSNLMTVTFQSRSPVNNNNTFIPEPQRNYFVNM